MSAGLDPERWRRIDDLFHHAAELRGAERSAYVRRVTSNDAALETELRTLLVAHDRETPCLEAPAHGGVSRLLQIDAGAAAADPIGSRLGAWRITRFLATGGMGAVYLATRDDHAYAKTVAVKLAHRGLIGSSLGRRGDLERRFAIERQVLANLDHPYIARLLDGGASDDGRPYFVMEYVEGLPINQHCDEHRLTLRDRLALLVRVCEAVQHAHQRLVIHRDLKPGNILVTDDGTPKLLDFGLAKMLDPHAGAGAGAMTAVSGFMGTFAYAAPEQVASTGHAPDTRTDVYALGVVMYRLISGQHPYDVAGPMSEALERIASQAPLPPSRHEPRINDELDTITLKALAKNPERRYASAGELKADIERYLRGEAIHAKADSGWYMLRKSLHRHRVAAAIAGMFLMLITAFAIFATFQATRLARQKTTLATALRLSNIEHGRAMGLIGNTALAESLIWREYVVSPHAAPESGVEDRLAHWALWELYLHEPCLRTIDIGIDSILAMACSSDERWIAVAGYDRYPFVVDRATGRRVCELEQKASPWRSLVFKPGSNLLAVAGDDTAVGVWDASTGVCVQRLPHNAPVISVDYSADGELLVSTTDSGVFLWDVARGEPLWSRENPETRNIGLAISPNGAHVAVTGEDGHVRLLDGADGTVLATLLEKGQRRSINVCFSRDGRLLAADADGTAIAIFHVPTRTEVARLRECTGWVRSLAFNPTHTNPYVLAAAGFDKTIHLWEVPSSMALRSPTSPQVVDPRDVCRWTRSFNAHTAAICAMTFGRNGDHIISAGLEPGIRIWEFKTHGLRSRWLDAEQALDIIATPDNRHVITAGGDQLNRVNIRNANTGAIIRSLAGHTALVSALALSPDGARLASSSYDGTVCVWARDGDSDQPLWRSEPHGYRLNSVCWSPDGREIAVASDAGEIRVHRSDDGSLIDRMEVDCDRIPSLRFSPDGRFLAASIIPQNTIVLMDRRSGRRVDLTGHEHTVRIVRFSPEGSMLVSAGDDMTIRVWRLQDGMPPTSVAVMTGHQQDLFALAFSPDGTTLASSGRGGVIRLWHVATGRSLARLPDEGDMIFNLAFSADGRRLFSVGRTPGVGVWDLTYYDRHIEGNRGASETRIMSAQPSAAAMRDTVQ